MLSPRSIHMAILEPQTIPVIDRTQDMDSSQSAYPLTCLDHNPLPFNVTFLLNFNVQHLEEGLAVLEGAIHKLVEAHPFLAGDVTRQTNNQRKNAWQIEPDAAISLLTLPMLQKKYFPGESMEKVQPRRFLTGIEEEEFVAKFTSQPTESSLWLPRKPILRFQANILTDGILLSMTFNHAAIDGAGATLIFGIVAAYCRDQTGDSCTISTSDKDLRAQINFYSSQRATDKSNSDLFARYCGLGEWSALLAQNWSGFLKSRASEMLTWRMSIPSYRIQYLKEACNNILREQSFNRENSTHYPTSLSTNDIVSALMAMILRQVGPSAGHDTELSIAIDIRDRFQFPTFEKYLGNMVMLIHAPITAAKSQLCNDTSASHMVLGQETLDELIEIAVSIRQRLLAIDSTHIQAAMSHLDSQTDWAEVGFCGSPLPLSSLRNFKLLSLDFGEILGSHPQDFYIHLPVLGGMCFILPKRIGPSESAERRDLQLTLHRDDLPRIANDPLFCWATDERMNLPTEDKSRL